MHVPELARLQTANKQRLQSNLSYWFKQLLPSQEAQKAAEGMAALIDGLWLRGAFNSSGIDSTHAFCIARMYLFAVLEHGQR